MIASDVVPPVDDDRLFVHEGGLASRLLSSLEAPHQSVQECTCAHRHKSMRHCMLCIARVKTACHATQCVTTHLLVACGWAACRPTTPGASGRAVSGSEATRFATLKTHSMPSAIVSEQL
eukprot:2946203-Pleurochrysis_carterae.AAC.2